MSEKSPIQISYDQIASRYADQFWDELSRKPFDSQLLDRFAAAVRQEHPGGIVWEVGCGPGQVARYLHDRGVAMCGLDLSEQMVAIARSLNPDIPFLQGTMLALPTSAGSLEGIVAFYSIIHLTRLEAQAALGEFWRVLRPGGYLLLAFHGGDGEIHTEEWFGRRVDVTATLFEGEEMGRWAQAAGLIILERIERPPYNFEHQSRRIYLWACKPQQERSDCGSLLRV